MDKLSQLKKVVESMKQDLDVYVETLNKQVEDDIYDVGDIESSEWFMQIADIYKAAYGEELELA